MRKYRNEKTRVRGVLFDSKKEAVRYANLLWAQEGGLITDLRRQVRFQIIPPLTLDGKTAEREAVYIADFVYRITEANNPDNGKVVIEDTKGYKTPDYILKRKLMKWHIRTGDLHDKEGNLYGSDTVFLES